MPGSLRFQRSSLAARFTTNLRCVSPVLIFFLSYSLSMGTGLMHGMPSIKKEVLKKLKKENKMEPPSHPCSARTASSSSISCCRPSPRWASNAPPTLSRKNPAWQVETVGRAVRECPCPRSCPWPRHSSPHSPLPSAQATYFRTPLRSRYSRGDYCAPNAYRGADDGGGVGGCAGEATARQGGRGD